MLAILNQAKDLAEIRDPDGKVVGFFAPSALKDAPDYARLAALFDHEEIERRKASKEKGYTTREVFEHLKSLTEDAEERAYLQEKIDLLRKEEEEGCATP
jgi:hypothetical protein